MTRLTAVAAAGLVTLSLATGALAQGHGSKHPPRKPGVYNASISAAPGVDPYAYPGVVGKAHLVDGKKNNQLSIHVRGLQPSKLYTWELDATTAAGNPCAAPTSSPVAGWRPKKPVFRSNASGVANGQARSKTFAALQGTTYSVTVRDGSMFIACGVFKSVRKSHPQHAQHPSKPAKPKKPSGKGHQ